MSTTRLSRAEKNAREEQRRTAELQDRYVQYLAEWDANFGRFMKKYMELVSRVNKMAGNDCYLNYHLTYQTTSGVDQTVYNFVFGRYQPRVRDHEEDSEELFVMTFDQFVNRQSQFLYANGLLDRAEACVQQKLEDEALRRETLASLTSEQRRVLGL